MIKINNLWFIIDNNFYDTSFPKEVYLTKEEADNVAKKLNEKYAFDYCKVVSFDFVEYAIKDNLYNQEDN
jgi:hypothetical protein